MALINCSECGESMSEFATKCPHCGSENTSKKAFEDIEITGDYESIYFTYAKEQMEAEMAAQEAAKEAAKRAEIAAQKAAAVEEEKRKQNQKRSRVIGLCLIVAIVIILIMVFVVRPAWQERKAEEQAAQDEEEFHARVQETEAVFSTIEDAMSDEVTDEELQVSGQMQDYVENGLTLFGDVNGQIEIELKDMKTKLWHIIFQAEDVTSEQIEDVTAECIEIFGKDYEYEFLGYGDRYIWYQKSYKSVDLKTDLSSGTFSICWTN